MLGSPAEALPVTQEAVELYRTLAHNNPDHYRPDLALNNLGNRVSELGSPAEARAARDEAAAVRGEES